MISITLFVSFSSCPDSDPGLILHLNSANVEPQMNDRPSYTCLSEHKDIRHMSLAAATDASAAAAAVAKRRSQLPQRSFAALPPPPECRAFSTNRTEGGDFPLPLSSSLPPSLSLSPLRMAILHDRLPLPPRPLLRATLCTATARTATAASSSSSLSSVAAGSGIFETQSGRGKGRRLSEHAMPCDLEGGGIKGAN